MNVVRQIRPMAKVLPRGRRDRYDLLRWLRHRPQILTGTAAYEMALLGSARMDPRLKQLAELKAAALVTCECRRSAHTAGRPASTRRAGRGTKIRAGHVAQASSAPARIG